MKLKEHIKEHHNGNRQDYADYKGVGLTQVGRWLKMGCIVIDGEVWRRVTVQNNAAVSRIKG